MAELERRPSPIAGSGWFAREDLPAGAVVAHVDTEARVDTLATAFPNHACDPTVGWEDARALVPTSAVPAGTELVTAYAMAIGESGWFLRCHCPSYRCRQMVEGDDWRIPVLQRRYAGWWAPRVQRLLDASLLDG